MVSSQKSINMHAGNDSSIVNRTSGTRLTWSFATDIKPNSNGPPRNGQDPRLTKLTLDLLSWLSNLSTCQQRV